MGDNLSTDRHINFKLESNKIDRTFTITKVCIHSENKANWNYTKKKISCNDHQIPSLFFVYVSRKDL